MFNYIKSIVKGIISLLEGLGVTFKHLFHRPITLQYPEEKPDLSLRFRGRLAMPVDKEKGSVRCTACMMCARACPNGSIIKIEKQVVDGKPKPKAAKFEYNAGTCMYCNLCVEACPFAAIIMTDDYELASYDKNDFILELVSEQYEIKGKKEEWWKNKFKEPASIAGEKEKK